MDSSEAFLAYISMDRQEAMAAGRELPHQTRGAALCADLSGFTSLTEMLSRTLGPRRGAEELALYLNRFYDALIAPIFAYGGSVIAFSGDAITCWFDADGGEKAIAAAQSMQDAMQAFADLKLSTGDVISLGIKVSIVSGMVRRFQVGDPEIQLWDTLAGESVDRLAMLGHLARTGEILLDEATATPGHFSIVEWRSDPLTGMRAAILDRFEVSAAPALSQFAVDLPTLGEDQIRPWLLPAVFARLQSGQGEFLTELRPAVALFMRFAGLNYDEDELAGEKLDVVIRAVQRILAEYDGTLLQLTIGDKGSYLYAAFGAPVAHEDDTTRAVNAALALRLLPVSLPDIHSVAIGLSRGVMRTGAYGSVTRRTYGVLGDEVNLAARLMENAASGQILASEAIWRVDADFEWQALPALAVKGKRVAITPAMFLGRRETDAFAVRASLSASPMIGRHDELMRVEEKLALTRSGHGQIVSIVAEAGIGKSRLLAEVLQRPSAAGMACYSGECQSYGTQSAYLVWHTIWRALFGIADTTPAEQIETLEKTLVRLSPDLALRMPLLGVVLNLLIPDNDLTSGMDARTGKMLRELLLVDCLRVQAMEHPLILILEDIHWMDPLSADLLANIGRAIQNLPILILLAHRPVDDAAAASFLPGLTGFPYSTRISLNELTVDEINQLLAARLVHFGLDGEISPMLAARVAARTQGNPFYAEELLNYLHDRGLDPRLDSAWEQAELPDSLHSLVLSRIDQLSERQQITIKAASVIGRLFRARWLYEYHPLLDSVQVTEDLIVLNSLDFVVQDVPEPQLSYLFKHVITQEVAYENLAYATRANLHEQFARYLEQVAVEDTGMFLDLLAYHYERSPDLAKKREYLQKAGEAAQKVFANEDALSYFGRALALAPEIDYAGRFDILLKRVQVYYLLGRREAQYQDVMTLLTLAESLDDNGRRAWAALNQASYGKLISDFPAAIAAAQQAVKWADLAGADKEKTHAYIIWGEALLFQSNYVEARIRTEQALALAQSAKLTNMMASCLNTLAGIDYYEGNYDGAETHLEGALHLWRETGSRRNEPVLLNNLGELNLYRDLTRALDYYEQTVRSSRETGDRQFEGLALSRLGQVIAEQRGDYVKARDYCEQASFILQEARDRQGELFNLCGLSLIDLVQNNYLAARIHAEQRLDRSRKIGDRHSEAESLISLCVIDCELGQYSSALEYNNQGLSIAHEIGVPDLIIQGLTASAMLYRHLGQLQPASENCQQALLMAKKIKNRLAQTRTLIIKGHAFMELGSLDQAVLSYQDASKFASELNMQHSIRQAKTGMAGVAFIQGNLVQAQMLANEILSDLEMHSMSTMDEIFWIYLTCYRILAVTADPRAHPTLAAAYTLLQEIAARIDDEVLRTSFLQNVRFNREIIEAWQALQK